MWALRELEVLAGPGGLLSRRPPRLGALGQAVPGPVGAESALPHLQGLLLTLQGWAGL